MTLSQSESLGVNEWRPVPQSVHQLTLRVVKWRSMSGWMCGSCCRGLAFSSMACTIIWLSFIRFSIVSRRGGWCPANRHTVSHMTHSASSGSLSSPGEGARVLQTQCHTWLTQLHQVLYRLQARGLVHCNPTHNVTHDWLSYIRRWTTK